MSASFRSIVKNAARLGSSTILGLAFLVVATKLWAVWLGPDGIGLYGAGMSLVTVLQILGGFYVGTFLVRNAKSFGQQHDNREYNPGNLWVTSIAIVGLMLGATTIATVAFAGFLQSKVLVGPAPYPVTILAITVAVAVVAQHQVNLINAHHRVKEMAIYAIFSNSIGAVVGIGLALWLKINSPPYIVLASLCSNLVTSHFLFLRLKRDAVTDLKGHFTREDAKAIWLFAGPYSLSMLVGAGLTQLMPSVVLTISSTYEAGLYKACTSIAVGYLGAFQNVFMYDYLPRISAIDHDSPELNNTVNEHLTFMLLLIAPLVLLCNSTARGILILGYSSKFTAAELLLQWMMAANVLRFFAWSLRYVVVAKLNAVTFLWTEAFNGITLLGLSVGGFRLLGLQGLGIGFWIASLLHLVLLSVVLRAWTTVAVGSRNMVILLAVAVLCTSLPLAGSLMLPSVAKQSLMVVGGIGALVCVYLLLKRAGILRRFQKSL